MDRMPLESAADFAANHARRMARIWGEDITQKPETLRCQSCGGKVEELQPCTWDSTLMVGECCAVHSDDMEPECTCRQSDVDLFDSSCCEYHNPNSPWNTRRRVGTDVQRYERRVA